VSAPAQEKDQTKPQGQPQPLLKRIDQALFDAVALQAREAPRRRRNHNLHQESEVVQRFLNVLQPGTYVRPHRHLREQPGTGFECFVVLQGEIGLLLLDGDGRVIERLRLQAGGPLRGIELAEGQFHTLVALSSDAVIFELKQGPYQPTSDKDFLPQYPAEGTAAAADQERHWRALFDTAA
jgi:cupin fold WbuC family metalloprotein